MKLFVIMNVLFAVLVSTMSVAVANEVNVYSARKEALIKPLLDEFTQSTGIKVNLVTGSADALITRMQSEGQFSPVDLLITTDAGRLVRAKNADLTQVFSSAQVNQIVPSHLRDKDNHWFGLTMRARPIMYSPENANVAELKSILDLAKPMYKGQICIRSSGNIYNQSMIAALALELGESEVQNWAEAVVNNMARSPKGGDRDQIKAVAAGQCSIAVANTYYLAGMLSSDNATEREQASKVKVLWTDQDGFGTHVNISGAAIAKHAPNVSNAQQLLTFMLRPESQQWYAENNHEYPVHNEVAQSDLMQSFGAFKAQSVALDAVGEGNADALKLMDRAGWK